MPETPKKISGRVDEILNRLNSEWDLQLPRLHGHSAELAESTVALARKCSARIRYLCFRLDGATLDKILEEFKGKAFQMRSQWVFKLRQERGTLPVLPITKSHLKRDVIRSRALGLTRLDEKQRQALLSALDDVLEDDYQLARASDSYSRIPGQCPDVLSARTDSANNRNPNRPTSITLPLSTASQQIYSSRLTTKPELSSDVNTIVGSRPKQQLGKRKTPEASKAQNKKPKAADSNDSFTTTSEGKISTAQVHDSRTPAATERGQSNLNKFLGIESHHARRLPPSSKPLAPAHPSFETSRSPSLPEIFDRAACDASSANTSIVEDDSQNWFPTLDDAELLENEDLLRSIESSENAPDTSPQGLLRKLQRTLEYPHGLMPSELPFEILYEIQSLSYSWDMSPVKLFTELEKRCGSEIKNPTSRWLAIKALAKSQGTHQLTGTMAWSPDKGRSPEDAQRDSTYLTATLHWAAASSGKIFNLQMNGPVVARSCRFHRVYGGSRFLILNVPLFRRGGIPPDHRIVPDSNETIQQAVIEWLTSNNINIASRQWRPFWIDDGAKELRDQYFNRVHLFAVSGIGLKDSYPRPELRPMSIEDFINWHAPLKENLTSTDLKLFARFKLGLSKTIPTVILEPDEFFQVEDKIGTDGETVMNDGNALMSFEMANGIKDILGLEEIPAVYQGRIAGSKGLWTVDRWQTRKSNGRRGFWIEVTPAQLKIKPHPAARPDAGEAQRTFEVSSWSRPTPPATINTQFVTLLNDRGVPPSILKARLEEFSSSYYDKLCCARGDSIKLRSWLQTYHATNREVDIEMLGALPGDKADKISMLLDAGLLPDSCSFLHDLFFDKVSEFLTWFVDKLKISIPKSTYCYCIPDPCDVLEEGEVHFGVSSAVMDALKGTSTFQISGCEGLVARNPANLPSDMQKIKFVHHHKLTQCRDVVIFSTKGKTPLASLLSGGDYDGDLAWTCWDQELVQPFSTFTKGPPTTIKPEECGITLRSQKLQSVFPAGIISNSALNKFMQKCLNFNMAFSYLGISTNTHQQLVYRDSLARRDRDALQTDQAIRLGSLASFLVDASKQGYELSDKSWNDFKSSVVGKGPMPRVAYKRSEKDVGQDFHRDNVVDYLKFVVARPEKDRILEDWNKRKPRCRFQDDALTQVFVKFQQQAERESVAREDTMRKIIERLKKDLDAVVEKWKVKASKTDKEPEAFRYNLANIFDDFTEIEPLQVGNGHHIYDTFDMVPEYWESVKASALYYWNYNRNEKLMWNLAGKNFCEMKARSLGQTRIMTSSMYQVTKIDHKAVKRRVDGIDQEPTPTQVLTSFLDIPA